jgi:hypothetical protein
MDSTKPPTSSLFRPTLQSGFQIGDLVYLVYLQHPSGSSGGVGSPSRVPVWRDRSGYDYVKSGTPAIIIECVSPQDEPDSGWARVILPAGEVVSCYKYNLQTGHQMCVVDDTHNTPGPDPDNCPPGTRAGG